MRPQRAGGPSLPYQLVCGVEPCPGGWLVSGAKLQATNLAPEEPAVFGRFIDLLDYRPAYAVIALHLPIGLVSHHQRGGRLCDQAARHLLGWPRSAAISSPPSRHELASWQAGAEDGVGLSVVTRSLMPRLVEVYEHIASYHQRTVFEVHPELSFYQLNGDRPLRFSKHTSAGRSERIALLTARLPGIDRMLGTELTGALLTHRIDAAAGLWTARRIMARAVTRITEDPEWDDEGLRMEFLR
jgi:predicted RNase H-like nuclease